VKRESVGRQWQKGALNRGGHSIITGPGFCLAVLQVLQVDNVSGVAYIAFVLII
jgi:hypothetical protein